MKKEADEIFESLITTDLKNLHLERYTYSPMQAMDELGLDEELINELVEDYVGQMIKSLVQFEVYLKELENSKSNKMELDYKLFRELAHKNLGVARNLRIKDSEILLYELIKKDDLKYLLLCIEALKVAIIKLNPQCAYNTLRLIKIKNFF
ncbi:hypothetical protein [Sulfurimonas sp.]|uniref:hypothetical protein n=1 Tax=Sulfurimonas sp. TaxID=2022749 RepID=UPI00262B3393|nr:hypothetical protein [Sulfurimonas sp.]